MSVKVITIPDISHEWVDEKEQEHLYEKGFRHGYDVGYKKALEEHGEHKKVREDIHLSYEEEEK